MTRAMTIWPSMGFLCGLSLWYLCMDAAKLKREMERLKGNSKAKKTAERGEEEKEKKRRKNGEEIKREEI